MNKGCTLARAPGGQMRGAATQAMLFIVESGNEADAARRRALRLRLAGPLASLLAPYRLRVCSSLAPRHRPASLQQSVTFIHLRALTRVTTGCGRISILTRIEAAETDLTPYDLIREVVAQTEDFQHAILLSITLRQADLDAGIRALWRGIQIHDFVDLFETLRDPSDTHRKASLGEFPTQQAHDHQGKHAIKSVDSEFLVGPMMARTKRKESRVFHATKCCFDVGLAPVGKDNLFVGPLIAVAEKHGFARSVRSSFFHCLSLKDHLEPGNLILSHFNFGGEELLHVTSREDALQTVPSSLQGRLLSPGDLIDMPLQHRLSLWSLQRRLAISRLKVLT